VLNRYRTRLGAVALTSVLLLAACSGDGDSAADTSSSSSSRRATTAPSTSTTKPAPPPYPLTGLPVEDATRASRPALTVKIDNAPLARPQAGLDKADVVIEEMVEGGVTRFLAVFQSQDAPTLGPVRSVRPIDGALVTPLRGLFAYSGGAPKFVALLRKAPVKDVGFDTSSGAYRRQSGYRAPHNLFTSTSALFALAGAQPDPPPPSLFHYLAPDQIFGGQGAELVKGMRVVMGERTTAEWHYDAGSKQWRRTTNGTPHLLADGQQFGVDNVILQLANYYATDDLDVSGAHVPTADVVGEGEYLALSEGILIRGTWRKTSADAVTEFARGDGTPLLLRPGRTWIMLVPKVNQHTVIS
jgi:hypothetical protein